MGRKQLDGTGRLKWQCIANCYLFELHYFLTSLHVLIEHIYLITKQTALKCIRLNFHQRRLRLEEELVTS